MTYYISVNETSWAIVHPIFTSIFSTVGRISFAKYNAIDLSALSYGEQGLSHSYCLLAACFHPLCAPGKLKANSVSTDQKIPQLRQLSGWVISAWQYSARWNENEWHAEFSIVVKARMLQTSEFEYCPLSLSFSPSLPPLPLYQEICLWSSRR